MRNILIWVLVPMVLFAGAPLPSWNEGVAKQAILEFVEKTTNPLSPDFVPEEERVATFDQDGTLWVEHPLYTQLVYCLDRVARLVKEKPELKDIEPYKTVLSGDKEALLRLPVADLEKIAISALTGMSTEVFAEDVKNWLAAARDPRWGRAYTELAYLPMQEVIRYFQIHNYKTYIVTGGGQDFVRVFAEKTYHIPKEQVIGSAAEVKYAYDKDAKPILLKEPKLLFNDNYSGKPEGIHLMIGRRPIAAFGNTAGDQEMLEYTKAGKGLSLAMLVLHDDAEREYAYGPATGLPDTKIGAFSEALYDYAKVSGWIVISMKKDWNQIFSQK